MPKIYLIEKDGEYKYPATITEAIIDLNKLKKLSTIIAELSDYIENKTAVKSVSLDTKNGIGLTIDNNKQLGVVTTPGLVAANNTLFVTGGDVFNAIENNYFIVTGTYNNNTYTADKTALAVYEAALAGKLVYLVINGLQGIDYYLPYLIKYLGDNMYFIVYSALNPSAVLPNPTNTTTNSIAKVTFIGHSETTLNKVDFNIPTKTSDLINDSDFPSDANYVHTDNNYTTVEKTKLSGIAPGAEVNVVKVVEDNSDSNNLTKYYARKEDNGITLTLSANGTLGIDTLNGLIGPSSWGYADLNYFVTGNTVYNAIEPLAPKASPTFTGTPKAPTAELGTNTTLLATTAFVTNTVANAAIGKATFQGTIDSETELSSLSDYTKGSHWLVLTAGTYVGQTCEVGDLVYCIADKNVEFKASDFTVILNNLDISIITNELIDALFE